MLTPKEFEKQYCELCGTQRCRGPETRDAMDCPEFRREVLNDDAKSMEEVILKYSLDEIREYLRDSGYQYEAEHLIPESVLPSRKVRRNQRFKLGDRVKINIPVLEAGDRDGVEYTTTGKNYWEYILEHPDEVYTIIQLNFDYDETTYELSGYLGDNDWYPDELILAEAPITNYDAIKHMTKHELADFLGRISGSAPKSWILWLDGKYIRN